MSILRLSLSVTSESSKDRRDLVAPLSRPFVVPASVPIGVKWKSLDKLKCNLFAPGFDGRMNKLEENDYKKQKRKRADRNPWDRKQLLSP